MRFLLLLALFIPFTLPAAEAERRLLYVATPGIVNDLHYGGHGILVFDMDQGHKFLRRIPFGGLDEKGVPRNVKGICASATTRRLYVSTTHTLSCLDLESEAVLWEKPLAGGCDRMSMTPDGREIYQPSFEKDFWNVVDAASGELIQRLETPGAGAHNTVVEPGGAHAYLAGLHAPVLRIVDTATHTIVKEAGPFSAPIRPFTVNGLGTLCFVNVNGLLGFEVGDLLTGQKLYRVAVEGYENGPVKRHGCPSHGIGLTPDERELWVCDGHNQRLHYFDATVMPPQQAGTIVLRDQPGWITFSLDGRTAWPSSGEVIDVPTHRVIGTLEDEEGRHVGSEKLLEIDFAGGHPVRAGDQFGRGQVR